MKFPNIDAERARLGMTRAELARECGIHPRTLYNWERNGRFQLDVVIRMSELFNCSLDYLAESVDETKEKEEV